MGRSTSSCFKIITCSSDSVDKDDFERIERKGSTDKRGWSFRKRSTRDQVLSNGATSETPSTGNKESPESTSMNFHAQSNPTVPGKFSATQWMDETLPLSTQENLKVPDPLISSENAPQIDPSISTESAGRNDALISTENGSNITHNLEDSAAIVIQASIRGYLAQRRVLLKLKNVVMMQAAIRGHLVRRQAVGTLRCIQSIVKMQALVRARRARMSLQGSIFEEKLYGKQLKNNQCVKPSGKANLGAKTERNYLFTEKWLSNGFARQLLESTPKGKRIHIKCDPSRPNSAWKWMERWMSVSSGFTELQKSQFCPEYQEQEERIDTASEVRTEIPADFISESVDLNSTVRKTVMSLEGEENLITRGAVNFDFQDCCPTSSARGDMQQPQLDDVHFSNVQETTSMIGTIQTDTQLNAISHTVSDFISNKDEADDKEPKHNVKRVALEQSETEGKKFVLESRKTCNPAFVAVQTKFEELSSSATSDKYEVGGGDFEVEPNRTIDCASLGDLNVNAKNRYSALDPNSFYPPSIQQGKFEDANGETVVAEDCQQIGQQPESSASDVQLKLDTPTDQQTYRSSPEGSPRSHIIAPESHGTPPSHMSVKTKRNKLDKSAPTLNTKSQLAGKRSPSNPYHDSGARSSADQLPKDLKGGKRRNSVGSARTEHVDEEPRDSNSNSNSLPSYMQATESARAKAHANYSPRSSPDVQDKDIYLKKRHSLPGANGKQGSPRVQQPTPQIQQGAKVNGTPTHEKKWQK